MPCSARVLPWSNAAQFILIKGEKVIVLRMSQVTAYLLRALTLLETSNPKHFQFISVFLDGLFSIHSLIYQHNFSLKTKCVFLWMRFLHVWILFSDRPKQASTALLISETSHTEMKAFKHNHILTSCGFYYHRYPDNPDALPCRLISVEAFG